MSDFKIAVAQSTGKREEHSKEMELPTTEEFARLLREDTLPCSSTNLTTRDTLKALALGLLDKGQLNSVLMLVVLPQDQTRAKSSQALGNSRSALPSTLGCYAEVRRLPFSLAITS